MGYLGGNAFLWPKNSGRSIPRVGHALAALIVFIGFNLTFFPQFILATWACGAAITIYSHMPEFQILNVLPPREPQFSASDTCCPWLFPVSMRYGKPASDNSMETPPDSNGKQLLAARPSILTKNPS